MIVHTPSMEKGGGEICITARFELHDPLPHLPEELWYRFPEEYEARLSPRADGFAATALLVAMYAGEALMVRGPISPRLAYSLLEYRNIFHSWLPKLFQMVDIQFEQLAPPPSIDGRPAVAAAFSGGVDSFYTLWRHLAANQAIPGHRITHGLFIRGLDLRLEEQDKYDAVAGRFAALYESLGLELIQASTNARQFSEFRIDWTLFHGPPLVGAALLLSPFLGRFYVPSFVSYVELEPQGTSPLTDHLLSTETLEVVHHGASVKRTDKLSVLVDWPVTYDHLRVCPGKLSMEGVQNCSACHKCFRTMASLSLLDALPRYRTFSGELSAGSYFRWGLFTPLNIGQATEIRNRAAKSGRFGMALFVQAAIILQIVRKFSFKLVKRLLSQEQIYRIKRKIYQP
jgi:hypothetical protein